MSEVVTIAHHPAKFPSAVLDVFRAELQVLVAPGYRPRVLDPFAGVGGIFALEPEFEVEAVEIEPEWASQHPRTVCQDVIHWMRMVGGWARIAAVATSPAYGNRMADNYLTDGSKRNTYASALGRDLDSQNSGSMQWGDSYREFHEEAWSQAVRLLIPGGLFLLNMKDHIRGGKHQYVTEWHTQTLISLGLEYVKHVRVPVRGNRFGQNHDARVPYEWVVVFRKPFDG